MFTLKFIKRFDDRVGDRTVIKTAESLTIIRDTDGAGVTMHRPGGDERVDVGFLDDRNPEGFDRVIIENAAGKTTEIISYA